MREKMHHFFEQQQKKVQEIKNVRVVVKKQENDEGEENQVSVLVIEKKETPQVASAVKQEQKEVSVVSEMKESLNISVKNEAAAKPTKNLKQKKRQL